MKETIPQTYRLTPDSIFKIKVMSIYLGISIKDLLESIINELWEKRKDEITAKIHARQANKESRRILDKLRKI